MDHDTPEAILASYRLHIRVQKRPPERKGKYALYQTRESYGDWFKVRVTIIRHPDGSICLEGIRSCVPIGYRACCEIFDGHLSTCIYDIRYKWGRRTKAWGIVIAESAGGGVIRIAFCPHCGAKLP